MNSCVARGLPVGRSTKVVSARVTDEATGMRRLLTNHLKMMREVMVVRETFSVDGQQLSASGNDDLCSKRELARDPALQFLVLQLPAIRHKV
jgi:hypothetical protein